jgi:hypothetical protein
MAGPVVILKMRREDSCAPRRLVVVSGNTMVLKGGTVSDQQDERFETEEQDEVEAHKRKTEMTDDASTGDESSDDFEAHRRRTE